MPSLEINCQGQFPILKPGDQVEIIAPAKMGKPGALEASASLLEKWGLTAVISTHIYGEDLLCANTDSVRLQLLQQALHNPDTKAIWCIRGGYGCTRLAPALVAEPRPAQFKTLIGFSDITCLHLLFNSRWGWPAIHGPGVSQLAAKTVDQTSSSILYELLFGISQSLYYADLKVLNSHSTQFINAPIMGGNLCLVECSIGTPWQIDAHNKILLLEEVGEAAYRVDRSLEHLAQAGIFNDAKAVLLGDFLHTNANELKKIEEVLHRFAESLSIPVYQLPGIGHGNRNLTIPLGIPAQIN